MKCTRNDKNGVVQLTAKEKEEALWLFNSHHDMLTQDDLEFLHRIGVLNGCGGKGSWIKPPYRIFFDSSCDIHDFTYWQGGTEEDRLKCDEGFLRRMIEDANRCKWGVSRAFFRGWAWLYFQAVRKHGAKYFNYTAQFII